MAQFEMWIEHVIRGEKVGFFPWLYRLIAHPISWMYRFGVWLRHTLYDLRFVRAHKVSLPVISVGNIAVGGTGKTEIVSFLTQKLSSHGQVAILTRGYRRQIETQEPLLVDPKRHTVSVCGDEPWLLATRHPSAHVIVCKDRVAGAHYAHTLGAQVLILDDGFQHRRLARDIELVLLQGSQEVNGSTFLPRGVLRDLPSRLKAADFILVEGRLDQEKIRMSSQAPIIPFCRTVKGTYSLETEKSVEISGHTVGIFCGIAKPRRFLQTVRGLGARVVANLYLPDHSPVTQELLRAFFERCMSCGAEWIVCTEKDKMKVPSQLKKEYPIAFVSQQVLLLQEKEPLLEVLERLRKKMVAR